MPGFCSEFRLECVGQSEPATCDRPGSWPDPEDNRRSDVPQHTAAQFAPPRFPTVDELCAMGDDKVAAHELAVSLGIVWEERPPALKRLARSSYEWWMLDPTPPSRLTWSDRMPNPAFVEWRRLRRGGRRSPLPQAIREFVIERDGYVCGICGGGVDPERLHIDHIYPRSRGGSDEVDNLQVAHPACNIRKGARV